ncbi:MAG: AsmA family protein [Spirochaetia bacterium]|uniref:AsmA family protein n=1 Tax=Candidatus Avelusimicrobium fimicolum TaxID=3416216 RepID=UPI003CBD6661|nr:AsmA family protein [Spirochaetia bacterium]
MKKLFKLLVKIAVVCVILLAAGLVALRIMFPPEKLKTMAVDYAKNNLQREISFDKISFNVIGVTLDNFALSENTSFQNGTFVKADKLVVKLALMPLLKKRVEIATVLVDGLDVNVIKNKIQNISSALSH